MTKLLLSHLNNNRNSLEIISDHINLAKNGTNIGNARESLISNFLEQNLPEFIKFHTGEIFDSNDKRSGQIDIIVHPVTSPKIHLFGAINLFPAECVMSAIEVKSNLNREHLKKALESCNKLKQLEFMRARKSLNPKLNNSRVPFIVFAFTGFNSKTTMKYLKEEYDQSKNMSNLPELILVLNKGYYIEKTSDWEHTHNFESAFTLFEAGERVLEPLFKFLLSLTEYWIKFPDEHLVRMDDYTTDFKYGIF